MKNLKEQVKRTLIANPDTRNSDITLTLEIWKQFYPERISKCQTRYVNYFKNELMVDCVALRDLYDLPREDNVKRIRAKFCERGYAWAFPIEWKIAKGRGINEDRWRQTLGYPILGDTIYPTKKQSYTEREKYKPKTKKEIALDDKIKGLLRTPQ